MNRILFAAVLMAILGAATGRAQSATGNIRGTVSDTSGGVLPNCSVTVTHVNTGLQRVVATNGQGDFNVPSVPVGEYKISVGLNGFQTKTINGLVLQVDQTATLPVTLDPGAVNQLSLIHISEPTRLG